MNGPIKVSVLVAKKVKTRSLRYIAPILAEQINGVAILQVLEHDQIVGKLSFELRSKATLATDVSLRPELLEQSHPLS